MNLINFARWAAPLLLLAITTLVYIPGLSGGFIFDDFPNIVTNERIRLEQLSLDSVRRAAGAYQAGTYGRPLATLTFAFDYLIAGNDPRQFKLTSLFVHLLNAVLVFIFTKRILDIAGVKERWGVAASFTVALIWAIHPIQVSSVLYVVQRMETLASTFILGALLAYLRGRTFQIEGKKAWPWLVFAVVLACIGMLSKETAVLFPIFALTLELTLLGFRAKNPQGRRALAIVYATGLSICGLVFVALILPHYASAGAFAARDFTLYESLLTQLRVIPMYLGQIIYPVPATLHFYYDAYPISTGLLDPPTTAAGLIFICTLLGSAIWLRKRRPLAAFGILWFFAAHALTSNVFRLEPVFEHRNYLALLGVIFLAADMLQVIRTRDSGAIKYVGAGAVVIVFGFLGCIRTATWGNELHLAMSLVTDSPASPRASNDLAVLYISMAAQNPDSPFYSMGIEEFERASLLPGSSPLPEQGLILTSASTGQPVKQEWWDRLIHKVQTRPIGPQETMAVTGLMTQRYRGVPLNDQELSRAYMALLQRTPSAPLFARYGDFALYHLGDRPLATHMFISAVDHSADDPDFAEKVALTLMTEGEVEIAKAVLTRADQMEEQQGNQ